MSLDQMNNILDSSDLSPEDKKRWKEYVANLPENFLLDFVEMFLDKPGQLIIMNTLWKAKLEAKSNPEKKKEVIEKERQMIQDALGEV